MSDPDFRINPEMFGVTRIDPGFIYVIEDRGRFKIGRTKRRSRLLEAKTWLPDMKVVGLKPFWNHCRVERTLQVGFAQFWYSGEWYDLDEDAQDLLVEGFTEFSDSDRDRNSVDFIYWVNASGMNEFTSEHAQRGGSRRSFLREESSSKK